MLKLQWQVDCSKETPACQKKQQSTSSKIEVNNRKLKHKTNYSYYIVVYTPAIAKFLYTTSNASKPFQCIETGRIISFILAKLSLNVA